jgi:hypothetical protein
MSKFSVPKKFCVAVGDNGEALHIGVAGGRGDIFTVGRHEGLELCTVLTLGFLGTG